MQAGIEKTKREGGRADPIEELAFGIRHEFRDAEPFEEYDELGNLVDVIDPKQEAISRTIDGLERKYPEKELERFYSLVTGKKTPVLTLLDRWQAKDPVAETTKAEKRKAVRTLAEWKPGICIEDVSRRVAGDFVDWLEERYQWQTVNKYLTGVSTYWQWLERRGYITTANPWNGLRAKKGTKPLRAPYFNNHTIPRNILAAVVGHKDRSITLDTYSAGPAIEQLRACVEAVKLPEGCTM
jgi:hypothetical protein